MLPASLLSSDAKYRLRMANVFFLFPLNLRLSSAGVVFCPDHNFMHVAGLVDSVNHVLELLCPSTNEKSHAPEVLSLRILIILFRFCTLLSSIEPFLDIGAYTVSHVNYLRHIHTLLTVNLELTLKFLWYLLYRLTPKGTKNCSVDC